MLYLSDKEPYLKNMTWICTEDICSNSQVEWRLWNCNFASQPILAWIDIRLSLLKRGHLCSWEEVELAPFDRNLIKNSHCACPGGNQEDFIFYLSLWVILGYYADYIWFSLAVCTERIFLKPIAKVIRVWDVQGTLFIWSLNKILVLYSVTKQIR